MDGITKDQLEELEIATLAACELIGGAIVAITQIKNQSVFELTMATFMHAASNLRAGRPTSLMQRPRHGPFPEKREVSKLKIQVDLGDNSVTVLDANNHGKLYDIVYCTAEADSGLNVQFIFTGRAKEYIKEKTKLRGTNKAVVRAGTETGFRLFEVAIGAFDASGAPHCVVTKVYALGSGIRLRVNDDVLLTPEYERIFPL